MWLVLDIGNSSTKAGLLAGGDVVRTQRIGHTEPDPARTLRRFVGTDAVERAGLASVVPAVTQTLLPVLADLAGQAPLIAGPALTLPFALCYETPHTLGTDRLAAAAAAWRRHGADAEGRARPVVAIDAGTAVTYEVIDASGRYLGGAIAAGPDLVRDGLVRGTAQLPLVEADLPADPIGRSTRNALQAGIMFGFVDGVAGMLRRVQEALGAAPFVVATGGWGGLLAEQLAAVDHLDPHLVLHGLGVLLALNPDGR